MMHGGGSPPGLEGMLVRFLRSEFALAIRLDASGPVAPMIAPRGPCALYLHVPFCDCLCPFCPVHRDDYRGDTSRSDCESVRCELNRCRDSLLSKVARLRRLDGEFAL